MATIAHIIGWYCLVGILAIAVFLVLDSIERKG